MQDTTTQKTIVRGSVPHRVLETLCENGQLSVPEIKNTAYVGDTAHRLRTIMLPDLMARGLVKTAGGDEWAITEEGLARKLALGDADIFRRTERRKSKAANVRATMDRPVYLGDELGRVCMRPGAYDAFGLPSVINGDRHPYRRQVA